MHRHADKLRSVGTLILDGRSDVETRRVGKEAEEGLLEIHLRLAEIDFGGIVVGLGAEPLVVEQLGAVALGPRIVQSELQPLQLQQPLSFRVGGRPCLGRGWHSRRAS